MVTLTLRGANASICNILAERLREVERSLFLNGFTLNASTWDRALSSSGSSNHAVMLKSSDLKRYKQSHAVEEAREFFCGGGSGRY